MKPGSGKPQMSSDGPRRAGTGRRADPRESAVIRARPSSFVLLASLIVIVLSAPAATADGGLVRLSQRAGPYVITVFTSPTPLRAGPADVSVLVQSAGDDTPVLDAAVSLVVRRKDGGGEVRAMATRSAATNKLLHAALLELPDPGPWSIGVHVDGPSGSALVSCELDVAPPRSAAFAYWPYLVAPWAVIAIYALHQRLAAAGQRAG